MFLFRLLGIANRNRRFESEKIVFCSQELYEVTGLLEGTRNSLTKSIWDYVVMKNLIIPESRSMFLPDEKLAKIFGTEPVNTFAISRLFIEHVF